MVSGPGALVDQVMAAAAGRGARVSRLRVSHAFHSALMDPVLGEFGQVLESVRFAEPAIPVVSGLTGRPGWGGGAVLAGVLGPPGPRPGPVRRHAGLAGRARCHGPGRGRARHRLVRPGPPRHRARTHRRAPAPPPRRTHRPPDRRHKPRTRQSRPGSGWGWGRPGSGCGEPGCGRGRSGPESSRPRTGRSRPGTG